MPPYRPEPERFWEKVDKTGECWLWTASVTPDGYGIIWTTRRVNGRRGRMIGAHRWVYEELIGPIPEGFEVDHLCRVRACVNPDHLEAVSRTVNNERRGPFPNSLKTHCTRGHLYSPENTYIRGNRRVCKSCQLIHGKAWRDKVGYRPRPYDPNSAERARRWRERQRALREAA